MPEPLIYEVDGSDLLVILRELWNQMGRIYITIGALDVSLRDCEIDFLMLTAIIDFFSTYFGFIKPDMSDWDKDSNFYVDLGD